MIGPTPLRFADPIPGLPPEPVMPRPQVLPLNTPASEHEKQPTDGSSTARESSTTTSGGSSQDAVKPLDLESDKTIPRIIPDDMHQEVRPEDVLPFFQLPSSGDVAIPLTLPVSREQATQPASSATYRQQ